MGSPGGPPRDAPGLHAGQGGESGRWSLQGWGGGAPGRTADARGWLPPSLPLLPRGAAGCSAPGKSPPARGVSSRGHRAWRVSEGQLLMGSPRVVATRPAAGPWCSWATEAETGALVQGTQPSTPQHLTRAHSWKCLREHQFPLKKSFFLSIQPYVEGVKIVPPTLIELWLKQKNRRGFTGMERVLGAAWVRRGRIAPDWGGGL